MKNVWFENSNKNSTCIKCEKKIYKNEVRCKFYNGGFKPSIPAVRFLCIKCASKQLRRVMKELEKAKAHQKKHRKDIINEKILEGI